MGKKLVLAEKPSVARDISRVLNCNKKGNGFFEGDKYIVTWALGHLVTLADPEDYNERYKTWRLEDLPMVPKEFKTTVIKQSSRQFSAVREQLLRKDIDEIIIATDAGREGELVARWIIDKVHNKKPIKRLWISSVTDKAIKEGFNNLKDGRLYENLYKSALARAEADWVVGINASRALTCKYNAQLSCGRVQTPTLAIIAKREEEIQSFSPKTYYGITAEAKGFKLTWQDSKTNKSNVFDKDRCGLVLKGLTNKNGVITSVSKTRKKTLPPQLYDLTELQREANRYFGFSAKETLNITQKLYENHKVLTYPRTDSRYLTDDIFETLEERIKACGIGPYSKLKAKVLRSPIISHKGFVDNSKVTDHHGIIPTEQSIILSELNDKERKIYDLVVKRFFAALFPPFDYEETSIEARIGEEVFTAKGKVVINQGWKEVYNYDEDSQGEEEDNVNPSQVLPNTQKGDTLEITSIYQTSGITKPPEYFNEGTLLSAMENPIKYMAGEDKGLIKTMGETGGLGTVATRADIIEKLFNSYLIEKKGKEIHLTSKGKQLLELVPLDLKAPSLTAQWEQKLGLIAKGQLNKDTFINEMIEYTKEIVGEIKESQDSFKHDNITRSRCPQCGKFLLEVNGKKGKILVCQDRECGHRKSVAQITNARCPNCHKKLELRGEGEGRIYVCSCGHKEKMSSFNERRKSQGDKVSKKDVSKFLKEQRNSSEGINTALADALAKLKKE
jgi:DNA topoisomerase-3